MRKVKAEFPKDNYRTSIATEKHVIVADEPADLGGLDTGMQPAELMCAALASCTSITLKMYGERKNWNFDNAFVEVELIEKEDKSKYFKRRIFLGDAFTPEMETRALLIASKCPVHKLLENGTEIITEILK